jgi:molybdenum cofactor synthesis domain-containing protein
MAFRAFILTASDAGSRGEREDKSAPAAQKLLEAAGYTITGYAMLPDDRALLAEKMREVCDNDLADLLVTTGGTGFSPRDITPEATLAVCERLAPGIPEAMRALSMKVTARAMLSRAQAGICRRSLIVNLPGSVKAVEECLGFILPQLQHGIEILRGDAGECGRK